MSSRKKRSSSSEINPRKNGKSDEIIEQIPTAGEDVEQISEIKKLIDSKPENKENLDQKPEIEEKIVKLLKKNGLDADFWKKQLEKAGIKTRKQLKHVDEEVLEELNKKTRYTWEKNAIRACFSSVKSKKSLDKKKEKETIIAEKQTLLKDLTKTLNDHSNEKQRMEQMNIEMEIPRGARNLHNDLTKMELSGTNLVMRKEQSPSEMVSKISSGQILRGYYIQDDIMKRVIPRKLLIKINEEVKILSPVMEETFTNCEFFSEKNASMHDHVVKHWGHNVAASVGVKGAFTLDIAAALNSTDSVSNQRASSSGYTEIKETIFVPMASFSLEDVSHYISAEALCELIKIEQILEEDKNDQKKTKLCKHFFEHFGSHYFAGTYHFGGRYTRSVICRSSRSSSKNEIIKLVKNVMQGGGSGMIGWFSGGVNVEHDNNDDTKHSNYDENNSFNVEKRLVKCGGPAEADTVAQWKIGLATYPGTWSIISQDVHKNDWKAVWDLLKETKPSGIKNINNLCSALKNAFEFKRSTKEE